MKDEEYTIDQAYTLSRKDINTEADFISEFHSDLIHKFKNLEKSQETQFKYKGTAKIVQDMVEDFVVTANKLSLSEYALTQIDIMKEYQDR